LTDTTFLIIDVVFLVSNIGSILLLSEEQVSATKWITDIYNLEWIGDPYDVQKKMNVIFDEVEQNEKAAAIYGAICEKYTAILDSFAAMFGSLVSAMIPDDAGATRIIVEMIIAEGMIFMSKTPFMALAWIYHTLIPTVLQEILKTKENLSKFFLQMLAYLKALLPNDKDTFWQRTKKHAQRQGWSHLLIPLIPGAIVLMPAVTAGNILLESQLVAGKVSEFIDSMIAPHTDAYAAVMIRVIPMVYATTLIFDRCS
jgi:hypothetical protein